AAHAPGRAEKAAGTTSHRNGAHPLAAARADDPTTAALPELGDPANAAEVDPAGSADVPFAEMADPVTPPARVEPSEPTPDPASVVRPGDRIALFVDGANMDGACRAAGYFVDYGKARKFFQASGSCYAAFYYTADFSAQDPLQQRFLDYLSHAGFIIRRKPLKVIRDEETGERFVKINLDTEIVLDMLTTADNYDIAFLFSGDSDFERAVELLRSRGKRVYVVTSRRSLSRELAYVADKPIFLIEDYESVLHRDERQAPPPPHPRIEKSPITRRRYIAGSARFRRSPASTGHEIGRAGHADAQVAEQTVRHVVDHAVHGQRLAARPGVLHDRGAAHV